MASKRALRVGTVPSAQSGESSFWSLEEGQTAVMTILAEVDEIVSVDQFAIWDVKPAPVWVNIGDEDPGRELGLKPSYRAFVPVEIDGERKLWSVGIGVHRQLHEIGTMADGLKGLVIKAKRTGSGLKTRYTVLSTGKRAKTVPEGFTVDEIVEMLGPDTREGILELIEERTGMSFTKLLNSMGRGAGSATDEDVDEVPF